MNLDKFFSLPPEHTISADDGYLLTQDLASKTIDDIPVEKTALVSDYLACALSLHIVEHNIEVKLDALLAELRKRISCSSGTM
jgi:hypothetical protein